MPDIRNLAIWLLLALAVAGWAWAGSSVGGSAQPVSSRASASHRAAREHIDRMDGTGIGRV